MPDIAQQSDFREGYQQSLYTGILGLFWQHFDTKLTP
jgi:hypothetical protein